MASINSLADVLLDWEGLLAALLEHPALAEILGSERLALERDLAEVRALRARQEAQRAGAQELTQRIKGLVTHGKEVAITIRAVAKGKLGYRNEGLVHFKVAPVRKRPRKTVAVEPTNGEPAAE
jgi:hypothetical protein